MNDGARDLHCATAGFKRRQNKSVNTKTELLSPKTQVIKDIYIYIH